LTKIICIGNRFAYPDNFGILVYEELKKQNITDLEIIEGGVGGLSLMTYFDDEEKILIVDFAIGYEKKILTSKDIAKINIDEFNHSTAFLYLLKSIKKEYTIYVCTEKFDESKIYKYTNDILSIARGL